MSKPRRVDFIACDEDFKCAYLGSLGFSTRYIITQTKLGPGQICYRLKKAHVRRMDYRDGLTETASIVLRGLGPILTKTVQKHLKDQGLV